jgi:hypothetical protein
MEAKHLPSTVVLRSASFAPISTVPTGATGAPEVAPATVVALCNLEDSTWTEASTGLQSDVLAVVGDQSWWPSGQGLTG